MGLLSFLNPLEKITDALTRAYAIRESAKNSSERIRAEVTISELELKRDVVISASINDPWWSPRSIMGWCVAIFVFRIVVWDTVFQLGVTPNPGDLVTWVVVTVIGFYFVSRSAETIASVFASRIGGRK